MPSSLKVKFIDDIDQIFCLDIAKPDENKENSIDMDIKNLIEERKAARMNKDWKKSDEIRDILAKKGILIKDLPNNEFEIIIQ